ncbi:hypothetical protein B9Z55_028299 [Caenorhabditis nigoni]|uniref:Uncharacterized protein n=2 Tax=Caenorhabditis nigoni TaxID=1611254 RepID=A0A2G5SCK7_9PELO|nr:hypothetical protein B9Z55_028299 [Caenorhabditis nigoni]
MVTLMTVSSMISEGPIGVVSAIVTFYYDYALIADTRDKLDQILLDLIVLNAIVSCIICLSVNSQYRDVARKTFCGRSKKNQVGIARIQGISVSSVPRVTASNAVVA